MQQLLNSSVVEFVETLLMTALMRRASDIHGQPQANGFAIRLRIDGTLTPYITVALPLGQAIIARIKVLAQLNVADHRSCQDGKLLYLYGDRSCDIRVAIFPSYWGEHIVLRLLTNAVPLTTLTAIGICQEQQEQLRQLLHQEQGFIVVTGPTGSGKTTTLYAMLQQLNDGSRNIMTLEDPIEYTIPGICQGQIQEETGLTFAQGIKALVRQDPDVIMIGEIRDPASARAALQAAMTGHLVLTCLHTADSCSALIRLLDMGIEPYLLNAAVTAVIAQRLFPAPCTAAAEHSSCNACYGTGIYGQTAALELLMVSQAQRQIITNGIGYAALRAQALAEGLLPLAEDLRNKVAGGTIIPQALDAVPALER